MFPFRWWKPGKHVLSAIFLLLLLNTAAGCREKSLELRDASLVLGQTSALLTGKQDVACACDLVDVVYLEIIMANHADQADSLLEVRSPAALRTRFALRDPSTPDAILQPVEEIPLQDDEEIVVDGERVQIMLLDLTTSLASGDEVELTLRFLQAGERTISARVR